MTWIQSRIFAGKSEARGARFVEGAAAFRACTAFCALLSVVGRFCSDASLAGPPDAERSSMEPVASNRLLANKGAGVSDANRTALACPHVPSGTAMPATATRIRNFF